MYKFSSLERIFSKSFIKEMMKEDVKTREDNYLAFKK